VTVDLRLIATRVANGDTSAFRHIVEHTRGPLFRLAARLMADEAEAEDMLQIAYVKAYRALRDGRFDGRSKLLTWLYSIVYRSCLDAKRKRRELPTGHLHEPQTDGNAIADARLALRELDVWLGELPDEQRAVIIMKLVEGMTAPEIARIMDCSEGAVQQRLRRARAALRKKLDAQVESEAHDPA
jgi:RNA polymerase sigma-70 factor (ECF subfamily)